MACVKRQLEHTDLANCSQEPPAKRCDLNERISETRSSGLREERNRAPPADDSRAQQHFLDLDHLKGLQRLNARYNEGLKYVQFRNLLVSFVNDLCDDFNLMSITVHRALNYMDRLLSSAKHSAISRHCYQIIATACILVAGKRPLRSAPQIVFF
jgi:hypothetical protein